MAFTLIEWIILFFLVMISFILTGYFIIVKMNKKRWNYTYNVLEDTNGSGYLQPTRKGRCRLVKVSDSGVEIFYLPKEKKYRTGYGKRSGLNHIIWAIDEAGYWHNVYFKGINKQLQEIGVNVVSPQARLAEASIRKIVQSNYQNKNFMEKYGTLIAFGMLFICIVALGVSQYMGYNQQQKVSQLNSESMKLNKEILSSTKEVIDSVSQLVTKIDILKSGGSGFVQQTA